MSATITTSRPQQGSSSAEDQIAALEAALADQDALLGALNLAVDEPLETPLSDLAISSPPLPSTSTRVPSSSSLSGLNGDARRAPSELATLAEGRVGSGSSLVASTSADLSTLSGSQKVIVGLASELADLRQQRATARGALARAQRDRSASEMELGAARDAVPTMRSRAEQIETDVLDRTHALADATARAERAEAETAELEKAGGDWDARVQALEQECVDVTRGCERLSVQMDALSAAWDSTRPAWAKQLEQVRQAAQDRKRQRQAELEVVRTKTKEIECLAQQREAERGDLLVVLDQWQAQRDRLLTLLKARVPGLSADLAKALATSVPASGPGSFQPVAGSLASSSGDSPYRTPRRHHLAAGTSSALDQEIDQVVREVQDIVQRARSGQV